MRLNKNFKRKLPSSGLYKKEQITILVMILCFTLSGVLLPRPKVKSLLIGCMNLPAVGSTDTLDVETSEKVSVKVSETEKDFKQAKSDKKIDKKDESEDKQKENPDEDSEDAQNDNLSKTSEKDNAQASSGSHSSSSSSGNSSPGSNSSSNSSSGSSSSNNSSSGSGSSGSSSSGSSSSAPTQTEKVWVPPVYQTVHHDAVYETVKVVVCNYCGAEFSSAGEFQVHKEDNGG